MSMTVKILAGVVVLCAFAAIQPAEGISTYRCGNSLVSVGDRKFEVEAKCGKPKSQEITSKVKVKTRYMNKTQYVEEWLYDRRYGWWDVLTFRGSRLVKIKGYRK